MSYKCLSCGNIFEDGEQANWSESRGEFCGTPCYKKMSGCHLCHGEYEETTPCEICGCEHTEDELQGGICEECIEKYRYNIEVCNNIGKKDDEIIKLNCFLALMFSKEEIEEILFRELQIVEKYTKIDCGNFIFEVDQDWFSERLVEEVKKNEQTKG